jgi:hypothetical protein
MEMRPPGIKRAHGRLPQDDQRFIKNIIAGKSQRPRGFTTDPFAHLQLRDPFLEPTCPPQPPLPELRDRLLDVGIKQQGSLQYTDGGNFNFGAVGAALGFPDQVLLRAAGLAQMLANTWIPSFGYPFWVAPYGDDPNDQVSIERGIQYYRIWSCPASVDGSGLGIIGPPFIAQLCGGC